jgi:hypothetical protein
MKDEIDVMEKRIVTIKPADIAALEGKPGIFGVMREIRLSATDEIVDYSHAISAREQKIDHVAADKTGTTGDDADPFAHAA